MRKFILILIISSFGLNLWAQSHHRPHLSPEEFRAKQQTFITQKAELSKKEAEQFFPVFFELQEKKRELNDKVRQLAKKGKNKNTSEQEYEEIVDKILDLRVETAQLEEKYYKNFRKLLPARKVYLVQDAEMNFHRELLKGVNRSENSNRSGGNGRSRNR